MLLRAPVAGGSLSYRGKEYFVDDQGLVEVPDEALEELRDSHGFEAVPIKPVPKPPMQKKAK
jgi:hypothetical protein